LMGAIGPNQLQQGFNGVLGGAQPQPQDTAFFYENILKPYTDLFAAQRQNALGQAKESAGNLTGSGYNNILGSATAESLAQEQAFGAQTMLGLRQQELQRQQDFLKLLFSFAQTGVAPNQAVYQPGFLDSILPFAGALGGQWLAGRGQNQQPGQTVMTQPSYRPTGIPGGGYRPFDYGSGQ
jgi:hypothetical protein